MEILPGMRTGIEMEVKRMKYIELASYLATANVLLAEAEREDNTDVTANIRQALCEAQLYFTKKALEDLVEELK